MSTKKTIKIHESSYAWLEENRNGVPKTKFLSQLISKIDVEWKDEFDFIVKKKGRK